MFGKKIYDNSTPETSELEDGDQIDVSLLEQVGMIGIFAANEDIASSLLLDKIDTASSAEVADLISSLNASADVGFTFIPNSNSVVGPKEQADLRARVDAEWAMLKSQANDNGESDAELEDFKLFLSNKEIQNILGVAKVNELAIQFAHARESFSNTQADTHNTHNTHNTWDQVIIRICTSYGKRINMHIDKSPQTMQVALNDDTTYEGGRLVFAFGNNNNSNSSNSHSNNSNNNLKLVVPQRAAGCITIHENRIAHGVTELKAGVRYGLFFIKNTN